MDAPREGRTPPQVSSLGRVRMYRGIVSYGRKMNGYRHVGISSKTHRVHRLVADAFLPPPPSTKHNEVNHKDGNGTNNRVDNLEWVTRAQNIQHSYDTNAERRSNAPKQSKAVLGRRVGMDDEWVGYESTRAAARALGPHHGNIPKCCNGVRAQTGGYEFEWAPVGDDQLDLPGEEWSELQLQCGALRPVSNMGRVRSSRGIVSYGRKMNGYQLVQIGGKTQLVHRLVASAFLPPPPSIQHNQVNHKDGNGTNNRVDNLEWVTPAQNIQHSFDTNAERRASAPRLSKAVLGRRVGMDDEWVKHASLSAAARDLELNPGSVSYCCNGANRQTRAGYEFEWALVGDDQLDLPGEEWRDVPP